jgi:hypothetical protein
LGTYQAGNKFSDRDRDFYWFLPGLRRQIWGEFPFLRLIHTLLGTLLVASGTGALNQYFERHFDAQMRRTAIRPLAAGANGTCECPVVRIIPLTAGCWSRPSFIFLRYFCRRSF